jgi:hypothetical protein
MAGNSGRGGASPEVAKQIARQRADQTGNILWSSLDKAIKCRLLSDRAILETVYCHLGGLPVDVLKHIPEVFERRTRTHDRNRGNFRED